jgi:hypothetical protein
MTLTWIDDLLRALEGRTRYATFFTFGSGCLDKTKGGFFFNWAVKEGGDSPLKIFVCQVRGWEKHGKQGQWLAATKPGKRNPLGTIK